MCSPTQMPWNLGYTEIEEESKIKHKRPLGRFDVPYLKFETDLDPKFYSIYFCEVDLD